MANNRPTTAAQAAPQIAPDPDAAMGELGVPAGRKSERTREEILAAAARLFRRRGVDAATLRHIAAEARLEAGSIYYHFDSKEAILDAVLDRGLRGIHEGVRDLLVRSSEGASLRETLPLVIEMHLRQLHAMVDFTSTNIRNFSQLPQEIQQRHSPLRRDYTAIWDAMLAAAQARGEIRADFRPEPLRRFVLGALNWTVEWFDPLRAPLSQLSEPLALMVLDGISSQQMRGLPIATAEVGPGPDDEDTALAKAERTREAILRSAARLIRDRGYTAATLRAIATDADIEAGSIYYHFRSKSEILDEVLDRGLREMRDGLAATAAEPCRTPADHRERIAAAIRAHLKHLLAHGEFTSANIRNYGRLPEPVRRRHRPVRAEYSALWEQVLEDARNAGAIRANIDVPLLRRIILGALNWTVEWFDDDRTRPGFVDAPDYTEMCVRLILDGVTEPTGDGANNSVAGVSNKR